MREKDQERFINHGKEKLAKLKNPNNSVCDKRIIIKFLDKDITESDIRSLCVQYLEATSHKAHDLTYVIYLFYFSVNLCWSLLNLKSLLDLHSQNLKHLRLLLHFCNGLLMNLKNYKNNLLFVNLLFKTVENYKKFIIKTVILNQLLKSHKTKKGDR